MNMAKDNTDKTRGSVCHFDEMVNFILLIMFVAVLSVLTCKGCSDCSGDESVVILTTQEKEDEIANDITVVDSTAVIQIK